MWLTEALFSTIPLYVIAALLLYKHEFWWPGGRTLEVTSDIKLKAGWFAVCLVCSAVAMAGISSAVSSHGMMDLEYRSGEVVKKVRDEVHCRHSYSCNCRTSCSGSGSSRSCSTRCDTCYEHRYDVDWDVKTNIGRWTIDTIDRQGLKEPPRWTQVQIGDPVTSTFSFKNYVKAVKQSLFNATSATSISYWEKIPEYTPSTFDYYKANKVINIGAVSSELASKWNAKLAELNKVLGPAKQANVIVVFTTMPMASVEAMKAKWLGGKKNDIIVVFGVTQTTSVQWVQVISWTPVELFKVTLRDELLDVGDVSKVDEMGAVISTVTAKHFKRRHMSEFEYLLNNQDINPLVIMIGMVLTLIISLTSAFGMTVLEVRRVRWI